MYFERWDVEDYNKHRFDVIQVGQTPMSPNVRLHISIIIKLMSYTVSTFMITMFDVQLQDDMASYPWLFWTEWAYVCPLWREFATEHTAECTHDSFLYTQNYNPFPCIALWKPSTVTSYSHHILELTMLEIEQAFKSSPPHSFLYSVNNNSNCGMAKKQGCVPTKTTTSLL